MTILEYIIGGVLLVLAIALITLIGLQQSKRRGLGNSIAGQGASESYLAKNKIGGRDKSYQKITLIVAIVFVVLILALYIIGSIDMKDSDDNSSATSTTSTTVSSTVSSTASSAESSTASTSTEASK
ncbi:MAG: preprotein translocase subunit SecG [Clostridia bacterium]|nr:preprotein translocase subunit SecG [Clostridia bacterium]